MLLLCLSTLHVKYDFTFAGEPELRKQLREKRLREMHQRMQAQLAEKQARDSAESDEKEQKVDLRNRVVKPKIEAWQQGKKVLHYCLAQIWLHDIS